MTNPTGQTLVQVQREKIRELEMLIGKQAKEIEELQRICGAVDEFLAGRMNWSQLFHVATQNKATAPPPAPSDDASIARAKTTRPFDY